MSSVYQRVCVVHKSQDLSPPFFFTSFFSPTHPISPLFLSLDICFLFSPTHTNTTLTHWNTQREPLCCVYFQPQFSLISVSRERDSAFIPCLCVSLCVLSFSTLSPALLSFQSSLPSHLLSAFFNLLHLLACSPLFSIFSTYL